MPVYPKYSHPSPSRPLPHCICVSRPSSVPFALFLALVWSRFPSTSPACFARFSVFSCLQTHHPTFCFASSCMVPLVPALLYRYPRMDRRSRSESRRNPSFAGTIIRPSHGPEHFARIPSNILADSSLLRPHLTIGLDCQMDRRHSHLLTPSRNPI